tara:strand:- start:44 stop:385 length:342 start_codon:yes stop_codon:yes gene_type:complete
MGTYRLFTNSQGLSQIEDIDLTKTPDWTAAQATTNITFREAAVGNYSDYHCAPRRQFVIICSGQLEIGLKDGSKHVFGPGDARLVEDITGSGHTTGTYGDVPCVTATVPLANQ